MQKLLARVKGHRWISFFEHICNSLASLKLHKDLYRSGVNKSSVRALTLAKLTHTNCENEGPKPSGMLVLLADRSGYKAQAHFGGSELGIHLARRPSSVDESLSFAPSKGFHRTSRSKPKRRGFFRSNRRRQTCFVTCFAALRARNIAPSDHPEGCIGSSKAIRAIRSAAG